MQVGRAAKEVATDHYYKEEATDHYNVTDGKRAQFRNSRKFVFRLIMIKKYVDFFQFVEIDTI